jgi:hypothetical protein
MSKYAENETKSRTGQSFERHHGMSGQASEKAASMLTSKHAFR